MSKSLTHAIENPKVSEKEIKDHAIAFASSQKENCNLQKEIQKRLSEIFSNVVFGTFKRTLI